MSDTVIPAMKTIRNFDPKQPMNLKAGTSLEVSVTSASITIESSQRSVPAQDAYRPEERRPPQDTGTYGPGASYGRKHGGGRPTLRPDRSFDLEKLFQNQRNSQLTQTEAYHKIEISITKIQISIGGSVPAEPACKSRALGSAYNIGAVLGQEKGREFYDKIQEVIKEFDSIGKVWGANTADKTDPTALQQLDDARIAWVTQLRESDPAGFRAWLQIHVGPQALNGNFDNCVKPNDFTLEDYNAWMSLDFADYESGVVPKAEDILGMEMPKQEAASAPEAPKQAEQTAAAGPTHQALVDNHNGHLGASSLTREEKEYLYDLFERCYDNDDSAYNNHRVVMDAIMTRREGESDDDFDVRWKSSLAVFVGWAHSQLGERKIMPDAIDHLQNRKPLVAKQMKGESDNDFMRRKINWDLSNDWNAHLLKTILAAEGMKMGESLRYQKEKGMEWVTNLMNNEPAKFREWLETHVSISVEQGWLDKNGNFTVATVPKGFTVNDYHQWMSKDTLEYL